MAVFEHHRGRLRRKVYIACAGLVCALAVWFLWLGSVEGKNMPRTPVYITCTAKGDNSAALCALAKQTVERVVRGSQPRKAPLDFDASHANIMLTSAPKPMPENAIVIDINIAEKQHSLTASLTVTVGGTHPALTSEQSVTIMDRNAPTNMDVFARFLNRFIPSVLEQDNGI